MKFYDLIHGYQPYQAPHFVPFWVERNLRDAFVPVSRAMKNGVIKRGVQLQGWTIENYLISPKTERSLAEEVINNLKEAHSKGFIEIGASAYSHPILPFFIDEIVQLQMMLDFETQKKYLAEPTWFWFPEGGVDKRTLSILFDLYPQLIATIPDMALGESNHCGFINVRHKNGKLQKTAVLNSQLKYLVSQASYADNKPSFINDQVDWSAAQNMIHSARDYKKVLEQLGLDFIVLARDWENRGNVDGLFEVEPAGKEVRGLYGLKKFGADFRLITEADWSKAETVDISEIQEASWDGEGFEHNDPYLYWKPSKDSPTWLSTSQEKQEWVLRWEDMISNYNQKFKEVVDKNGGVERIVKNKELSEKIKSSFTALLSCVPWHFLASEEYGSFDGFSKEVWQKIVTPSVDLLEELA